MTKTDLYKNMKKIKPLTSKKNRFSMFRDEFFNVRLGRLAIQCSERMAGSKVDVLELDGV
jgi:hypothetical protein